MTLQLVDLPSVPLHEPVLVFSIALALFLIAPMLFKRFGLPGIVGIVLGGAALGPGGFGIVDHVGAIILLGEVGLIYLLFTLGMELDLRGFLRAPESAALFGLASFGLPFLLGAVGGYWLIGLDPLASVLLAAVFASHTLLAYPVVNRLGLTKNDAVTAVFGGILFTDTIALVVLAIVLGAVDGGLAPLLFVNVAMSLVILFGSIWLILPRLGRWFFRGFSEESYFEFLFVLVVFFMAASLAELLDLAGILGAFAAGLAINRLISEGGTLHNRLEFAGNAFFIPFFLLHVGMLVEVEVILDGTRTLAIAGFIIGVMLLTKGVAAWVVGTIKGYSTDERTLIWGLSTGQAAAALAITLLGYEAGLFDSAILNAVVLMLLVTAIISPWLTERAGTRLAAATEVTEAQEAAFDPRILLPLSHSADLQRRLLELAFLLKGDLPDEPIHVLTVVQPRVGTDTEARVAAAREELVGLEEVASAAEVPISVETRVNHNIPSGIAQAALEEGANLVMMGWDARQSLSQRMFGSVIDNVLRQVRVPAMIARLGHPVNTTGRVFLVFPRGIIHHGGFFEVLYLVKTMIDRLGAPVRVIAVDRDIEPYERVFGYVDPELEASFEAARTWSWTHEHLQSEVESDDLVVVLAAKPGEIGWHDALNDLPNRLAALRPESFLLVYPREGEPGYDRQFLRFE